MSKNRFNPAIIFLVTATLISNFHDEVAMSASSCQYQNEGVTEITDI